jgi:hypothetical protein
VHNTEATLGPYGPYHDWPLKASGDEDKTVVPGAPIRDVANAKGDNKDLFTGETFAPLQHEGPLPNPTTDPTSEV